MQFIDEAVIHLKAGDGGNGSAAMRREDGVPHGGPSGGDGGNGGSITFVADPQLSSLLDFKYRRHYLAERGEDGRNKDQYGAKGPDLVLRVPVGTVVIAHDPNAPRTTRKGKQPAVGQAEVFAEDAEDTEAVELVDGDEEAELEASDEDLDEGDADAGDADAGEAHGADAQEAVAEEDADAREAAAAAAAAERVSSEVVLADLSEAGARYVVAKGGIGGKGNIHFKTPWNQAPRTAEPGTLGEERIVRLELKLLADVGLLGFPNVGKSTFISRVSRARPKIGNYPFTTLTPNLGVVSLSDERNFVIADIPGLIEGASEGAGLGHQFLRHVERCRVLLHILDATFTTGPERTPLADFDIINRELRRYAPGLADKPQVVVLNKIDATASEDVDVYRRMFSERGVELLTISAATGTGVSTVLEQLWSHLHPSPDSRKARRKQGPS